MSIQIIALLLLRECQNVNKASEVGIGSPSEGPFLIPSSSHEISFQQ